MLWEERIYPRLLDIASSRRLALLATQTTTLIRSSTGKIYVPVARRFFVLSAWKFETFRESPIVGRTGTQLREAGRNTDPDEGMINID